MNITLHDYIRGITNVHHSTSTWTIEPRIEINNPDGLTKVERGVCNQVSAEFNLLYRFHSAISERDDKWSQDFHKRIFGDVDIAKLSIPDFIAGALKFEASIPKGKFADTHSCRRNDTHSTNFGRAREENIRWFEERPHDGLFRR